MEEPRYRISVEPAPGRVQVRFNGVTVADSDRALILHETRHAPVHYLPKADVRMDLMEPSEHRTHCPFKGNASYWGLRVDERVAENSVWAYEKPLPEAEEVRGYVAFYRERMDTWYEEREETAAQPLADAHEHGNPLVDWLMREAWDAKDVGQLVYRLAHRLQAEGVELTRATLMLRALHPQVMGTVNAWTRADDNIRTIELGHADGAEERFLSSPYVPIFAGRGGVRRRLEGPDARIDFPVLEDIRAEGATDYAALPLAFSDGQIHALTLATDALGGFRTEDLGHIHEILPLLGRLVEVHSLHRTARTLLDTYLGVHTGARVLEGRIRRGDGERIPAVVWMADLRGSTTLQETLDRDVYLDLLNEFFEATAGSAIDAGGEVLKFIGDAVLAIFPIQDEPRAPYQALSAAREALARIDRFNAGPDAANGRLGMALALHIGEVNYGNIGVPGRLDFTATGPVVNEVSRLEGLCKVLGKPVVTSGAFAASVDADLVSQGRHELRGVAEPVEVFTLPELA